MKNCKLKIFCDFDGTISKNDVWVNSLENFIEDKASFEKLCSDYVEGRITTRECNDAHLSLVKNFDLGIYNSILDKEPIDEYFRDFLEYCRENNHSVFVLSDGMDYYINYVLQREGIEIETYSCKMNLDEKSKRLSCEYVYTDDYCKMCETCKRNLLIANTNDLGNELSVYIGDSVSDFCVSGFADIVFAKGRLASQCWKNNITYFEYNDFSDIRKKLVKLTSGNSLRHRQEAKNRRMGVLMGG